MSLFRHNFVITMGKRLLIARIPLFYNAYTE